MTLEEVRAGIDAVDTQMKPLFLKRMECGKHVAEVKAQTGGDVFVLERELEIIDPVQPSFPEYKLRPISFADFFNKPDSVCLDSFEQLPLVGQIDTCNRLRTYDAVYIDLQ